MHCGFATITEDEVKRLRNTKMTTEETTSLFERIHADQQFREKLLASGNMSERMEIIWSKGFSCSANELRGILETFMPQKSEAAENNFSLWGNKIPRQ